MATAYAVGAGMEAWTAEGTGDRARVGVAVVHGFTGNPLTTTPLGRRLNADGYTVSVPRLPGHGTHVKDMAGTRYADWLAEVERTVDELESRCDQVVVAGLSMGGALCLDVASRRSVAGVVAINSPLVVPDDIAVKLVPVLQHVVPSLPASMAGLAENDANRPGVDEKAYSRIPLKAGHSLTRALRRIETQLPRLTAPILVAWGKDDHSVPPSNSRAILEKVGSSDARELVLENSCHLATLDLDRELLEDAIAAFVADVTGV